MKKSNSFVLMITFFMISIFFNCTKGNRAGQKESINPISSTSSDSITYKAENIKYPISEMPSDFLSQVSIGSPVEKVKEIFGIATKIIKKENTKVAKGFLYNLKNVYLLIETKDNETIDAISILSKGTSPYIEIGNNCPNDFYNGKKITLGKSIFQEIDNESEIEISRDRCTELGFIVNGNGGGPCNYYSYLYGSVINYEKFTIDQSSLNDNDLFFEGSYGKMSKDKFKDQIIDYLVISNDENLIKNNHPYGEGIHCEYIQ